jgi:magnesium transporter
MINVYTIAGDRLTAAPLESGAFLPRGAVWIDMLNPSADDDKRVEDLTGVSIPTREDMGEIEESSRFYSENGASYLIVPLLHAAETEKPGISPVSFILHGKLLISVRYAEPRSFTNYAARAAKSGSGLVNARCDGLFILLGILESATDRLADILESVTQELENSSNDMFGRGGGGRRGVLTNARFKALLTRIGAQGAFLSKVRESLAGLDRLCAYLAANEKVAKANKDVRAWIKSIDRDVVSLEHHVDFLSHRITFLMDTMVGLISVEQNSIIKIFSVAAVAFMPPTLVASIYGMNFRYMPELAQSWGYPMALVAMVLSAVLPLVYFRWRGWL